MSTDPSRIEQADGFTLPEVGDLFHRVNSVIPEEQDPVAIHPDAYASEALDRMREHGFSQLPVMAGGKVIGVFSYQSFAEGAVRLQNARGRIEDLSVHDFIVPPVWVRANEELANLLPSLNHYDAVFVGDEDDLQGIVTSVDLSRFLERLAEPFVRLGEIELTLRAIVRAHVDPAEFAALAAQVLEGLYDGRPDDPPDTVEGTTLGELVQLVRDGRFWPSLGGALGAQRERASTRLGPLTEIRNRVFHFRDPLQDDELVELRSVRDWLRQRLMTVQEGQA